MNRLGLNTLKIFVLFLLALIIPSGSQADTAEIEAKSKVVLTSEVVWGALNPARGDKGPRAANLWGDRRGTGASGFLVKFVDGFTSPPHIHNVIYRAVVIRGLIHNDDPDAAPMWMPSSSYWTQPAGEVHITSARGSSNLIYVEIQEGPYLVRPTEEANDSGERPINLHSDNIVWLNASSSSWIDDPSGKSPSDGPKIAFLWGNPTIDNQPKAALIRLPAGYTGYLKSKGANLRAVVIQGRPKYKVPGKTSSTTLEAGSFFSSQGNSVHEISTQPGTESIIYVRTESEFIITPRKN
jgi:hypothetical protein